AEEPGHRWSQLPPRRISHSGRPVAWWRLMNCHVTVRAHRHEIEKHLSTETFVGQVMDFCRDPLSTAFASTVCPSEHLLPLSSPFISAHVSIVLISGLLHPQLFPNLPLELLFLSSCRLEPSRERFDC